MLDFFDYFFLRLYIFYKGRKDSTAFTQSMNFISIMQLIIVFLLFTVVERISLGRISIRFLEKENFFALCFLLFAIVWIMNWLRYRRVSFYRWLKVKFSESPFNEKIKMWMLFTLPVLLFVVAITFKTFTK